MKILTSLSLLALTYHALADIDVPGANGSSGVLNITEDTVIDLSQAADGAWDGANTVNGIYDASQWAVVFNYASVNIAEGTTVTFTNHPSKAPVVWLVAGDVTIAGTVSLNGHESQIAPSLAEGGPGGFRGGTSSFRSNPRASAGFGPGGGFQQNNAGRSGSYGTAISDSATYGNPSLIPLIGGSGAAADPELQATDRRGGGGGGGAILIACEGSVTLTGTLRADGGQGISPRFSNLNNSGGSGGGIRLVCDSFTGDGNLTAAGGSGWQAGGSGRIRIERVSASSDLSIVPDPSVVPIAANDTALLWPPATAPQVRVVSIGGENAPADPRAAFGAEGADVSLGETESTPIVIETTNVEQASTVQVRVTPRSNANATVIDAAVDSVVSTNPLVVRWTADLPVNTGYSAVQVKVVRP